MNSQPYVRVLIFLIETESKLLYLQCIILEVLRIRAPTPMSIPHATSKDDVYKNWLIPKEGPRNLM